MNAWKLGRVLSTVVLAGCIARTGTPTAGPTTTLFDGRGLDGWRQTGAGRFSVQPDGSLRGEGGKGIMYYTHPFRDFVLELDWKVDTKGTDSGVYLRADSGAAGPSGYQIQIRDSSSAGVYERYQRMTGAIDSIAAATHPAAKPAGEWNHYRIEVVWQHYRIWLNGELVNDFFGTRGDQGLIGLESPDTSHVSFRNVRVTSLAPDDGPEQLGHVVGTAGSAAPIRVLVITATHGFRHTEAIDASKEVLRELGRTTEFRFDITDSASAISAANLARYDVLFLNNATLRLAPADTSAAAIAAVRTQRVKEPLTREQERAIADFVRSGKGVALTHSGMDAMYGSASYREMVGGGLFAAHPWVKPIRAVVEDRTDQTVAHFGTDVWVRDEIYVLDTSPRATSHVLMSMDMASAAEPNASPGRTQWPPAASRPDQPLSWVRRYGEGRVFATVLGHFGDVWHRPDYLRHVLQGLRVAAGRMPAPSLR